MESKENTANGDSMSSIGGSVKMVGEKVASVMDKGSEHLLSSVEALEGSALATAVKLSDGAKFLRDTTSGDVVKDCCTLVEKYPFHAMAAGTFVGLLLGRSLWRQSRDS